MNLKNLPMCLVDAYFGLLGGGSVFNVMGKDTCIEHGKTLSKCFDKETQSFDKNSSWYKYPDAMCKKTVLIQLAKLLPKSVELKQDVKYNSCK